MEISKFHTFHISIHTLRMEGDTDKNHNQKRNRNFNPHPPHGG